MSVNRSQRDPVAASFLALPFAAAVTPPHLAAAAVAVAGFT